MFSTRGLFCQKILDLFLHFLFLTKYIMKWGEGGGGQEGGEVEERKRKNELEGWFEC